MNKECINRGTVLMKLRMYEEYECKPVEAALGAVEDVRKLIAEIPAEEAQPDALVGRWIPVTERLPGSVDGADADLFYNGSGGRGERNAGDAAGI